jgi:hypothetical protein
MEQAIQEQYRTQMNAIAKVLDETFNGDLATRPAGDRKTGFALLIFPFGQPDGEHRSNYISNANREDMLATMKEFIARSEGRFHEPPDGASA